MARRTRRSERAPIYTASQYVDTTSPRRSLPEWTRFDLGVRYTFENPGAKGKLLVARLNVDNVLDTNYWAAAARRLPVPRRAAHFPLFP